MRRIAEGIVVASIIGGGLYAAHWWGTYVERVLVAQHIERSNALLIGLMPTVAIGFGLITIALTLCIRRI